MNSGETYERRRAQHIERWAAALPGHLQRLAWDRARIDAHQQTALRSLVATARTGSPWHRRRLAEVDPATIGIADLPSLPTMTKHDVLQHFDELVADPGVTLAAAEAHLADLRDDGYLHDKHHVVASGGSSGTRAVFAYGWDAWVDVHLGLGRRVVAAALADATDGPTTVGLVAAGNATHMSTACATTFRSPAVDVHPLPVGLPLREIVGGLNACQPHQLMAYASMLGVLAAEATAGRLTIRPSRIVAISEPLLPEVREAAETAFGAPVANCWAASEGGALAVGCWQGAGMHLNEDLVIVEPVDHQNGPVPPGEPAAKVLLTTLFNPLLPLIRYELTDEVTLLTEPCPCGSAFRRVADVQGRADELLRFGTVVVHPHVLRSVLGRHRDVTSYQIRQDLRGIKVLVTSRPAHPANLERELRLALSTSGLHDPRVEIEVVRQLDRHPSTGKLARVVPMTPLPG